MGQTWTREKKKNQSSLFFIW